MIVLTGVFMAIAEFMSWLLVPLCVLSMIWFGLTFAVRNDDPMPWSASAALISSISCYLAVHTLFA
ncbi:hypothetical protein [Tardiphaga sp.]|uniref:hypothetical protein n=1 Tax=Tardiphaga sp. TaxID=1926292 RepID=UPI002624082B|nr:hypothetical protein [Tardiphaga sp.]